MTLLFYKLHCMKLEINGNKTGGSQQQKPTASTAYTKI